MIKLIERLRLDIERLRDEKFGSAWRWVDAQGAKTGHWRWKRDFADDLEALISNFLQIPTHKHVKRGGEYVLIGFGKMQAEDWVTEHGRDGSRLVDMLEVAIYRCVEDGTLWVRPKDEFEDGRFVPL